MQPEEVETMIITGLPGAQAQVTSDDNTHFAAIVIYEGFIGQSPVKQHQMVYNTLGNSLESNNIHALSLKTYTPQAWEQNPQ